MRTVMMAVVLSAAVAALAVALGCSSVYHRTIRDMAQPPETRYVQRLDEVHASIGRVEETARQLAEALRDRGEADAAQTRAVQRPSHAAMRLDGEVLEARRRIASLEDLGLVLAEEHPAVADAAHADLLAHLRSLERALLDLVEATKPLRVGGAEAMEAIDAPALRTQITHARQALLDAMARIEQRREVVQQDVGE